MSPVRWVVDLVDARMRGLFRRAVVSSASSLTDIVVTYAGESYPLRIAIVAYTAADVPAIDDELLILHTEAGDIVLGKVVRG